jgi:hypothetical protein
VSDDKTKAAWKFVRTEAGKNITQLNNTHQQRGAETYSNILHVSCPHSTTSQGTWARSNVEKAHAFAEHSAKQTEPTVFVLCSLHCSAEMLQCWALQNSINLPPLPLSHWAHTQWLP